MSCSYLKFIRYNIVIGTCINMCENMAGADDSFGRNKIVGMGAEPQAVQDVSVQILSEVSTITLCT